MAAPPFSIPDAELQIKSDEEKKYIHPSNKHNKNETKQNKQKNRVKRKGNVKEKQTNRPFRNETTNRRVCCMRFSFTTINLLKKGNNSSSAHEN